MPKEFQYLSKRRKNQVINCEIHYYKQYKVLRSTDVYTASNITSANSISTNVHDTVDNTIGTMFQDVNEVIDVDIES